jgi:hypothetical protein
MRNGGRSGRRLLRPRQRVCHELIEARASRQCLQGCALVEFRRNPHHKLGAVGLARRRRRQRLAVPLDDLNPLVRGFSAFAVNLRFIVAVNAALKQSRAAADEAVSTSDHFTTFR